jgi:hypothetical protein
MSQYLGDSLAWADAAPHDDGDRVAVSAQRLAAMAQALQAMGKRVVIVQSVPTEPGFDVGRCLALQKERRFTLGAPSSDCSIARARSESANARVRAALDEASRLSGAPVVRLADALCDGTRCRVEGDGVPLYQDGGHLSHAGSGWLGRRMQLSNLLWRVAR